MNVSKKFFVSLLACALVSSFGYGMNQKKDNKKVVKKESLFLEVMDSMYLGKSMAGFDIDEYKRELGKLAEEFKTKFALLKDKDKYEVVLAVSFEKLSFAIKNDFFADAPAVVREMKRKMKKLSEPGRAFFKLFVKKLLGLLELTGIHEARLKAQRECIIDRQSSRVKFLKVAALLIAMGFFIEITGAGTGLVGKIFGGSGQRHWVGLSSYCLSLGFYCFVIAFASSKSSYNVQRRLLVEQRTKPVKEYFGKLKQIGLDF